ncbi:tRNA (N6-threonylcarbamoyladenosine(37)-N6)-methyltransferase TrmO [Alteromonas sp. CYL-A6]|uniref:tRNA (N6-threonylcarbamoyladenosine(37)-N6)-methyltransferase TrmO n=1 Tax=Alteromonas nitratireducens TaxID=3390813 RepID=UPI0034AD7DDB
MPASLESYSLTPIGHIATPFRQKFAIPRQPNLVNAKGMITFLAPYSDPTCFKDIDAFSHLWLLFLFHETMERGWKPAVKAPRLGGNATLGVFASRSTHRPNGIGMSVVRNGGLVKDGKTLMLEVEGVDLLDGTPIIDIKPYLPYADGIPDATDALPNPIAPGQVPVIFAPDCEAELARRNKKHADFRSLLTGVLAQDPRPAYRHKLKTDERDYHVALYDADILWRMVDGCIHVIAIRDGEPGRAG